MLGKLLFKVILPLTIALIGYQMYELFKPLSPIKLEETWWGPGKAGSDDTTIRPFKINISEEAILDLENRLKNARPFAPPLENALHHYGMNTDLLQEIVDFWKSSYDWREREKFLNQYPQFTTQVQGLNVHYIHVRPKTTRHKVLPMLMLHGWPGSVREFYDIVPKLTAPREGKDFVFELIVASLPGFGFSDGATKQGLGGVEMAPIFKNLMQRLGFEKYYVHGGDFGSVVVGVMTAVYPEKILGAHSNSCPSISPLAQVMTLLGSFYPPLVVDKKHESKMYPPSGMMYLALLEMGYLHIQATKPDTVGVAVDDSPVGLAAYILEKFISHTNMAYKDRPDGGLKLKYKYEDLLDNVMIYWVTKSATTSFRLYAETFRIGQRGTHLERVPITVPTACIRFPHELLYTPDSILKIRYRNLVQTTDVEDGGHFAAFEMPDLMAEDIWSAVEKMERLNR